MTKKNRIPIVLITAFVSLNFNAQSAHADKAKLGENFKQQLKTIEILVDGQKKAVEIDEQTEKLLERYRLAMRKIDNTKRYNDQLRQLIADQKLEKVKLAEQTAQLQVTNQEIVPLMTLMVKTLEELVQNDSPFLKDERTRRVDELVKMMARADVTNSEKYRRILEAYMIEAEYGKTLEAYRGLLPVNGEELTVDYLRFGRTAFLYQTLDGETQAVWNSKLKTWTALPNSYRNSIRDALKIARKQSAPDMIQVPVFKTAVAAGGAL